MKIKLTSVYVDDQDKALRPAAPSSRFGPPM
jgi:hypothetical protein